MLRFTSLLSLLLVLCLLAGGCSAPKTPADSVSGTVSVPESSSAPASSLVPESVDPPAEESQPPVEQDPQAALDALVHSILTNVDRPMPDFETIPFVPTAAPYTAQEAEALTGDEPWQQMYTYVFPVGVIDGYLFDVSFVPSRLMDDPFNGTLVAVCPTPDTGMCVLTADGSIWLPNPETYEYELAGTLPGIDTVTIDTLWAASACDGEVFWFVYGTQVARVYLPTGRLDVGTLSAPCRLFKPLTRDSLYCLYEEYPDYYSTVTEKSGATYLKFWDDDTLQPVTQARFDLTSGTESALTATQTLQLQRDGYLIRNSEYVQNAWDAPLSYADYLAGERALHSFDEVRKRHLSSGPVLAWAAFPFHYETDQTETWLQRTRQPDASLLQKDLYLYYHRNMDSQYDANAQWNSGQLAIHLDCPLNGHILQSHFNGGSLYIWTDDNQLYRSDADGQNPQLLLDLTDKIAPDSAEEPQALFAGPTFWLKQGAAEYRVYLPDAVCDTIAE